MMFNEFSEKAQDIMMRFEVFLIQLELDYHVSFPRTRRRMAVNFLNEIEEFKPAGE